MKVTIFFKRSVRDQVRLIFFTQPVTKYQKRQVESPEIDRFERCCYSIFL
jgi:hypothetical protein